MFQVGSCLLEPLYKERYKERLPSVSLEAVLKMQLCRARPQDTLEGGHLVADLEVLDCPPGESEGRRCVDRGLTHSALLFRLQLCAK